MSATICIFVCQKKFGYVSPTRLSGGGGGGGKNLQKINGPIIMNTIKCDLP